MTKLNSFNHYKSGFVDGKWTAINVFKNDEKLMFQSEMIDNANEWYQLGYKDGYDYFFELVSKGDYDIEKIDTKELQFQFFERRVIEFFNDENSKMVDSRGKR